MEFLNVIYQRDDDMLWHAFVENHPEIKVTNEMSLENAQETIYFLICNEFWYRHRSLSSWAISTETIKYLNHDFNI